VRFSAYVSDVEGRVLCSGGLQTPSGPRGSSGK